MIVFTINLVNLNNQVSSENVECIPMKPASPLNRNLVGYKPSLDE